MEGETPSSVEPPAGRLLATSSNGTGDEEIGPRELDLAADSPLAGFAAPFVPVPGRALGVEFCEERKSSRPSIILSEAAWVRPMPLLGAVLGFISHCGPTTELMELLLLVGDIRLDAVGSPRSRFLPRLATSSLGLELPGVFSSGIGMAELDDGDMADVVPVLPGSCLARREVSVLFCC